MTALAVQIATVSYPEWRPDMGTLVLASVGIPRNANLRDRPRSRWLSPHGIFPRYNDDEAEYRRRYFARLDKNEEALWDELAALEHDGTTLVIGCWCKLHSSDAWCHRRIAATWFATHGIEVVELGRMLPECDDAVRNGARPPLLGNRLDSPLGGEWPEVGDARRQLLHADLTPVVGEHSVHQDVPAGHAGTVGDRGSLFTWPTPDPSRWRRTSFPGSPRTPSTLRSMQRCKCGCGETVTGRRVFVNKEHQLRWMMDGGAREIGALQPLEAKRDGGRTAGRDAAESGRLAEAGLKGAERARQIAVAFRASQHRPST